MKYTHFCQHHDKPCCPDCISTNHKDCVGLLSIREIIKSSKTSTLIDNIEQNLTDIKNNIDKIMTRILCSSVSKCEFILTRICLIWS
jgi:hypothetical protein